jgi:hypothetical protein
MVAWAIAGTSPLNSKCIGMYDHPITHENQYLPTSPTISYHGRLGGDTNEKVRPRYMVLDITTTDTPAEYQHICLATLDHEESSSRKYDPGSNPIIHICTIVLSHATWVSLWQGSFEQSLSSCTKILKWQAIHCLFPRVVHPFRTPSL